MTRPFNLFLIVMSTLVLGVATYLFIESIPFVHGEAPSGLQATVATSSNPVVNTTASLVVASSTCAARIISTTGTSGIMISFADTSAGAPNGLYGHYQAASSTVAYNSGLYGCGAVRIYSYATQSISVSEAR